MPVLAITATTVGLAATSAWCPAMRSLQGAQGRIELSSMVQSALQQGEKPCPPTNVPCLVGDASAQHPPQGCLLWQFQQKNPWQEKWAHSLWWGWVTAEGPPGTVRVARPDSGKWIAVIYRGNHTESYCLDVSMNFRSKVKNCFSKRTPKCRNKQEKQASLLLIHFPQCQSSTEPQAGNINDALPGLGSAAWPQSPLSTPASDTRRGEGIGLCLLLLTEHFHKCIPSFRCSGMTYLSPNVICYSQFSANCFAV